MSFRNKRTIILAIVAIVACALSTAMGGGVFLSLVLMVVIGIVIAIVNQKSKTEREQGYNKQVGSLSPEERKEVNEVIAYTVSSMQNNSKAEKKYPIMFKSVYNQLATVTDKFIVVVDNTGRILDLRFAPFDKSSFGLFKDKAKQRGTVMMDVGQAAMIGSVLGGIGAGAYSAAQAAKINSEGGLKVQHDVKINRISYRTPDIDVEIQKLWIDGEETKVPTYRKDTQELCNQLNSRIGAVRN